MKKQAVWKPKNAGIVQNMSGNDNRQGATASWAAEEELEERFGLAEAARLLHQFPNSVALSYAEGDADVREGIIGDDDREVMRRLTSHWRIQLHWIQNPARARYELENTGPVSTAIIIAGCITDLRVLGGPVKMVEFPTPESLWIERYGSYKPTRGWDTALYRAIEERSERRRLAQDASRTAAATQVAKRQHMKDGGELAAVQALETLMKVAETTQTWQLREEPVD